MQEHWMEECEDCEELQHDIEASIRYLVMQRKYARLDGRLDAVKDIQDSINILIEKLVAKIEKTGPASH